MVKNKNIVLIGFMATGKSTVGRSLEDQLGWAYISTDDAVIKKDRRQIVDIFKESGEEFFRTLEREAVQEASERLGVVIDCGGGVIKNPDNVSDLKRDGLIFWLQASPEVILERVKQQPARPLLSVDDPLAEIKKLLAEREDGYRAAADHIINANSNDFQTIAAQIIEHIKQ